MDCIEILDSLVLGVQRVAIARFPLTKGDEVQDIDQNFIIGVLGGASDWVNEFIGKIGRIKEYSTNQDHHIVAKSAWSECGSREHDFYLDKPRKALNENLEHKVDDRRNRVSISNSVHRYIHTKLYYFSIFKNFSPLTDK